MSYFSKEELACKHCLESGRTIDEAYFFDAEFRELLDSIRAACGFPLVVSSGYRCVNHPLETAKRQPGSHTKGQAVDLKVSGEAAHTLLRVAIEHGIQRIGVSQKGAHSERFIHLDVVKDFPSPAVWSY